MKGKGTAADTYERGQQQIHMKEERVDDKEISYTDRTFLPTMLLEY